MRPIYNRSRRRCTVERNRHRCSLAHPALRGNRALMRLHDGFCNRQPQAGLALNFLPRFFNTIKTLENVGQFVFWDTGSGIRNDNLDACLPLLRTCRQVLVVIPASREAHPRIVDVLRDDETLGRLRRVHYAFGEALRNEQRSRELDVWDP